MRKPCQHGHILPRGLTCSRGYLFIRLYPPTPYDGPMPFLEGCKPHTPMHQKVAEIKLQEYRKKILLGEFSANAVADSLTVDRVCDIYLRSCDIKNRRVLESIMRRQVRPHFGRHRWDQVTPEMAQRWRERRENDLIDKEKGIKVRFSTVNREQAVMSAMFSTVERWVKTRKDGVPAIRLPKENPFLYVRKPGEAQFERDRVPNREEMGRAKAWCLANDPDLWNAILQATVTMLRRSDFRAVQMNGKTEGIQGKTGHRFKVYARFPRPADLTNWRRRWDALRRAMQWDTEGAPTHTVWHDLRHWGPTILAEHGYTSKLIQKLTGHATEAMADRYTGLREEKRQEAAAVVQREMESL